MSFWHHRQVKSKYESVKTGVAQQVPHPRRVSTSQRFGAAASDCFPVCHHPGAAVLSHIAPVAFQPHRLPKTCISVATCNCLQASGVFSELGAPPFSAGIRPPLQEIVRCYSRPTIMWRSPTLPVQGFKGIHSVSPILCPYSIWINVTCKQLSPSLL